MSYRGQIAVLREQIAGQHTRILWMERSHTSNEEIHQEKLAEYHLRIKEVSDIIIQAVTIASLNVLGSVAAEAHASD